MLRSSARDKQSKFTDSGIWTPQVYPAEFFGVMVTKDPGTADFIFCLALA